MFGVQLYKNNARTLLSRILSILNLDWLQHARSVRGVYEYHLIYKQNSLKLLQEECKVALQQIFGWNNFAHKILGSFEFFYMYL